MARRARDLEGTRRAVLEAATCLFAERGFEGTSMQAIATRAGVSRGTPGYAFGSKRALYEAVFRSAFELPRALAAGIGAQVADDPRAALRAVVDGYVDFLAANPMYVRLLERAALDPDHGALADAGGEALREALAAVEALASPGRRPRLRPLEPRRLLVSVLALCFFPFAHRDTLLVPLGIDLSRRRTLAKHKAHVVDLLASGIFADDT